MAKAEPKSDPVGMEICVATDLSPAAEPAVALAMQWAREFGAEVRLLHVVHDPVLAPALTNDVPGDLAKAREALRVVAASASVHCIVDVQAAEDVAAAIVAAARQAAYLIVGSHGRSGWQALRLGSIAIQVVRRSKVPVVVTPPLGRQPG